MNKHDYPTENFEAEAKKAKTSDKTRTKYCDRIDELSDQIFATRDPDDRRKIISEMNALKNKRAAYLAK